MKRVRWSKLISLAAVGIVTQLAMAQNPVISVTTGFGSSRAPVANQQLPARIPSSYTGNPLAPANQRAIFEGPNATDYFNFQQNFNVLANPQIATGPEDILMIVNSQIFRTPNGNAQGVSPTTLYPNYTAVGGQGFAFQRAFLDNWIGVAALNQLCPTGAPSTEGGVPADSANTRSTTTCQFENATVKYDQMHGRFLVLFTVVDTGLTFDPQSQGYVLSRPRKASWVLLNSRFAILTDQACLQGTTTPCATGSASSPAVNPGPNAAGTYAFVVPTPPVAANTGGVDLTLWTIYYGNAIDENTTDGFGSDQSASGTWIGKVGFGNINAIAGVSAATPPIPLGARFVTCPPTLVLALITTR